MITQITQAVSLSSHGVDSVGVGSDAKSSALDVDFMERGVRSLRVAGMCAIVCCDYSGLTDRLLDACAKILMLLSQHWP